MKRSVFTEAERIERVWDVLQIKNLMGRRAYYYGADQRELELDTLWVQKTVNRATASLGNDGGYLYGSEEIRRVYADEYLKQRQAELEALCAADTSIENVPENLGLGSMRIAQLTSPYIEIAEDGKTAQGMWYLPGLEAHTTADGVEAKWVYQLMGADFMKEDGQWKIWHLFIGTDFSFEAGTDYTKVPVDLPMEPDPDMTIPMMAYTSRYNWYGYPPIPNVHRTMADVVSNGPEGNPNYGKEHV